MAQDYEATGKAKVEQDRQNGILEDRSGGVGTATEHCAERRADAIAAGRTDRQGRDFAKLNSRNRNKILGKILSQLRKIEKAHLAYTEAIEGQLEAKLKESRKHKEQIISDIQQLEREIKILLHEAEEDED